MTINRKKTFLEDLFAYNINSTMKFNITTINNTHHSFLVSLFLFCAYIIPNRIINSIITISNIHCSSYSFFRKYFYIVLEIINMIWRRDFFNPSLRPISLLSKLLLRVLFLLFQFFSPPCSSIMCNLKCLL